MSPRKVNSVLFGFTVVGGFTVGLFYIFSINPIDVWHEFSMKAKEMALVEAQYEALHHKYFELQHNYFELERRHNDLIAKTESKKEAEYNFSMTGSKEGKPIQKINYEVPANLSMEQLYLLAHAHMKERRFAEAAKTFEAFLTVPEGAAYQNANSFYESGVAWFEIHNFVKAREAFTQAKIRAVGVEKPQLMRKVELWMMILDHRKVASVKTVEE